MQFAVHRQFWASVLKEADINMNPPQGDTSAHPRPSSPWTVVQKPPSPDAEVDEDAMDASDAHRAALS